MSKLIFADQAPEKKQIIESGAFWPAIDLNDLRVVMRIGESITDDKLMHAAIGAISFVNIQLKKFKQTALEHGHAHLKDIEPDDVINGEVVNAYLYRRAVYSWTNREILEKYSDYDATGKSADRADAKQDQADDARREAYDAIADITGNFRVDCELV